jgi:Fe-S oxidoreductase
MWMEEHQGKRINEMRVDQALALEPNVIATACPYCLTMLEDGLKTKNLPVQDKDIAEQKQISTGITLSKPPTTL